VSKALFAVLLDGGFLTKKIRAHHKRPATAVDIVDFCDKLRAYHEVVSYELLRIYYYDAHPSTDAVARPVSKATHNLAMTARYRHAQSLFDSLVMKPSFALRMGDVRLRARPEKC
jgi:hypothetical protein